MQRLLLALAFSVVAAPVSAGPIEQACLGSGRAKGDRALCGCIQGVANQTLGQADQRRAAKFFRDPHKAQEVRQSDRANHEAFWQRYKNFGETAEAICAPPES